MSKTNWKPDPALLMGLFGFVCCFALFWPGFMSVDSVFQLKEAVSGDYSSAHPPIMSLVWRTLSGGEARPAPVFVLHLLLFWTGAVFFALSLDLSAKQRGLLMVALFWPATFWNLSTLWKDIALIAGLLWAWGLCAYFGPRPRSWSRLLALGLALLGLLYATLVRQNAFPVTAPVAFFLTWQLLSRRRLPLAALSAVFVVVLGFGNILLTPFWVRNTTDAALSRIYAADLMGISKFARQNLLPDYLCAKQNPLVCIDERYSPVCGDLNFRPLQEPSQCAGWSLPFEETSAHKTDLAHRFSRAVEAHPLAYLRHRAEILAAHLGLKSTKTHLPYYLGYADNPWGYAAVGIVTSFLEERLIRPLSKTAFFEHWPFLVILGALIALLWRHKSQAEAAVFFFAVSAGLGANFFVIPCGDYRYSLWLNIFVFLALGLFLEARSKKEREEKKDIK